jgi:2-keto-3-deoxy-L-rhamnonate aldolase RhmA
MWTFFMDVSYDEYLPRANDETIVIVQIETAEGIRNLESIAAVEGVDLLFAGPMDISAALGHIGNLRHPDVQKFLDEFPARAQQAGKPSAITLRGYEASKWAYEAGYRFVSIGSVVFQGSVGLTDELRRLRELAGK